MAALCHWKPVRARGVWWLSARAQQGRQWQVVPRWPSCLGQGPSKPEMCRGGRGDSCCCYLPCRALHGAATQSSWRCKKPLVPPLLLPAWAQLPGTGAKRAGEQAQREKDRDPFPTSRGRPSRNEAERGQDVWAECRQSYGPSAGPLLSVGPGPWYHWHHCKSSPA